jgi:hypothetical protein
MLNCNTCVVGITMLFSSIYLTILKQDKTIFTDFVKLLDDEQTEKYYTIVKERVTAYVVGMILGVILALYYYSQNPKEKYILCTFLAIIYLTKLGVYYFYPKSPLFLYSLKNTQQTDAWAKIYEEMKGRYKVSLLIGFVGYLLLFHGLK